MNVFRKCTYLKSIVKNSTPGRRERRMIVSVCPLQTFNILKRHTRMIISMIIIMTSDLMRTSKLPRSTYNLKKCSKANTFS